jgi:hypothetical protein
MDSSVMHHIFVISSSCIWALFWEVKSGGHAALFDWVKQHDEVSCLSAQEGNGKTSGIFELCIIPSWKELFDVIKRVIFICRVVTNFFCNYMFFIIHSTSFASDIVPSARLINVLYFSSIPALSFKPFNPKKSSHTTNAVRLFPSKKG